MWLAVFTSVLFTPTIHFDWQTASSCSKQPLCLLHQLSSSMSFLASLSSSDLKRQTVMPFSSHDYSPSSTHDHANPHCMLYPANLLFCRHKKMVDYYHIKRQFYYEFFETESSHLDYYNNMIVLCIYTYINMESV